jgi:blue copper oxidase
MPLFLNQLFMKKIFIALLAIAAGRAEAQHLLAIPDTLSGTTFNLTVHPDSVHFKAGPYTQTFGVNASKYLGPTLMIKKGDSINITVTNQMGDTTTMHWHGLHVAPQNDGGPFSMIMNGMSWSPGFAVRNNAATYWYHPHMMAKTAAQAIKGDAGMIIVRDDAEAALNLPRAYGVDDFPIIVQSLELDTLNQFMPKGMVDSVVLVNGTDTPYVGMPAQVVRMRLLNASGERTFNFGFTGNKSFSVIANDGGLLAAPANTTRIRLSPGERAEILLDLGGMNGQTVYLMSYASELPMGVQGGPTMPMPPGSPLMNSPLNGIDFNILKINVSAPTAAPVTTIPTSLVSDSPYPVSSASVTRRIIMSADSMMVMDGPFYLNGNKYDMDRIDYRIGLNNTEIWTVKDSTMVGHPFHLHGFHFYVLDRNGVAVAPKEAGRKDVVLVQPNETVRIIVKFDDFADTSVPYMFHCHILMHEDDGMMGQFKVGAGYLGVAQTASEKDICIYPNPADSRVYVKCAEELIRGGGKLVVYNLTGNKILDKLLTQDIAIDVSRWPKGIYIMSVISGDTTARKSFMVE